MRRLRGVLLAGLLAAVVAGCNAAMKKDATFVFGETHKAGEWLEHDCWKQREATEAK